MISARQSVDVIDNGLPLQSIHFQILNFPDLYGRQDTWDGDKRKSSRILHAKLEASPWIVELTGLPDIANTVKRLKQDVGYGFTYSGVITHSDGTDFLPKDVETLLTALRTFLSFACGAYCSFALVEGRANSGERSWVRWGAHHVTPWNGRRSWLRWVQGWDVLSALFPRFWHLFEQDHEWRDTMSITIEAGP